MESDKPRSLQRQKSTNHSIKNLSTVTHIKSLTDPIEFNGCTKSLFKWLSKPDSSFSVTPVLGCYYPSYTIKPLGYVNKLDKSIRVSLTGETTSILECLVNQRALYISNTHKHHLIDKKSIRFGTLVITPTDPDNFPFKEVLIANKVLAYMILDDITTTEKPTIENQAKVERQTPPGWKG